MWFLQTIGNYRSDKNFPKPFFVSGNRKKWDGTAIQYWLDKKSGR